jgi:hypothetical protein
MSINETQASIKAAVWQAIAQSDVDVSGIEKETLNALVEVIVDASMEAVDDQLDTPLKLDEDQDIMAVPDEIFDDEKEDILWQGRPFLSMVQSYTITDERIRITSGAFGKFTENIELVRIQDLDYRQAFTERMLNIGDITIKSQNPSRPHITLRNVKNPEQIYEILRRAVLKARKRHGFTYREEM